MRTPQNLTRDYDIEEICPSRKLWRAWRAYDGPYRWAILSTITALQHSGAMAQPGDSPNKAKRVHQDIIAGMLGRTRPTITKRISLMAAPDPRYTDYCPIIDRDYFLSRPEELSTPGEERRRQQSQVMKDVAKSHPHWARGEHTRESKAEKRIRRQIGCFITRNKDFASPNCYSPAMDAGKLPQIIHREDPEHDARILFEQFGEMFDPAAHRKLGVPTNGFDNSVGWNWDEKLPFLRTCKCKLGQKKFDFQKVCPDCGDKGFVADGSMPDIGRYFYQTLTDLGLKKRLSRCADCKEVWDQRKSACPKCGQKGQVIKEAGKLKGWTQPAMAKLVGCDVSTLRKYERAYSYLGVIRIIQGKVYRKCSDCTQKFALGEKCPKCGKAGKVKREAHEYMDLTDRTMHPDIVKSERERLQASLRLHKRWLEQRQYELLQQAVELAEKVLREWAGYEHKLESFWNEMRRRLQSRSDLARFRNVLFPIHRE